MRWYILYNETRISPDITFNVGESTYFFFAFCWMREAILLSMQLLSIMMTLFSIQRVSLLFLLHIQKEIDLALLPCVQQGFFEEKRQEIYDFVLEWYNINYPDEQRN